jgi:hypothetical protein
MRILWLLGQILIVGMRFKLEVGISSPALFSYHLTYLKSFMMSSPVKSTHQQTPNNYIINSHAFSLQLEYRKPLYTGT